MSLLITYPVTDGAARALFRVRAGGPLVRARTPDRLIENHMLKPSRAFARVYGLARAFDHAMSI